VTFRVASVAIVSTKKVFRPKKAIPVNDTEMREMFLSQECVRSPCLTMLSASVLVRAPRPTPLPLPLAHVDLSVRLPVPLAHQRLRAASASLPSSAGTSSGESPSPNPPDIIIRKDSVPPPEDESPQPGPDDAGVEHIPKPRGEPGRPGSGGYSLENEVNWEPDAFKELQVKLQYCSADCVLIFSQNFVNNMTDANLDVSQTISGQDYAMIEAISDVVSFFKNVLAVLFTFFRLPLNFRISMPLRTDGQFES
jgi:hypothetical protein